MKKVLIGVLLMSIVFQYCTNQEKKSTNKEKELPSLTEPAPIFRYGLNINEFIIDTGVIEQNQGLTHILPQYGIDQSTIFKIADQFDSIFDVRKIKANHPYYVFCKKDSARTTKCFVYEKNAIEYVVFNFEDSLNVFVGEKEVEVREQEAGGIIKSSLWNAFIDNGLTPALVMKVAGLYAWTIDFFDIQKGDNFKVIYEAKYVEGEFIGTGEVKAVLFNHRSKDYYAFRYEKDSAISYYSEKGVGMKRALLSAPLEYSRISSKFSNSRFHPVLKIYRPHHGVDYAAPRGTEVVATGDGVVTFAGYSGGAGNMVKIKHTVGNIETKYLHLSKFGPGVKKGVHVLQGQKIGEVGSTGISTGPHLDYRIYVNGKAVDPLSIDVPASNPIADSLMQPFLDSIMPIKMKLDSILVEEVIVQD